MPEPLWSSSRRWVLIVLLTGAVAWFGVVRWRQSAHVPWPLEGMGSKSGLLLDRLDPNTASAAELSALPTIGPVRAEAIVTYREQWRARHPGEVPFASVEDLANVKGIGPATIEQLRPWLWFGER